MIFMRKPCCSSTVHTKPNTSSCFLVTVDGTYTGTLVGLYVSTDYRFSLGYLPGTRQLGGSAGCWYMVPCTRYHTGNQQVAVIVLKLKLYLPVSQMTATCRFTCLLVPASFLLGWCLLQCTVHTGMMECPLVLIGTWYTVHDPKSQFFLVERNRYRYLHPFMYKYAHDARGKNILCYVPVVAVVHN